MTVEDNTTLIEENIIISDLFSFFCLRKKFVIRKYRDINTRVLTTTIITLIAQYKIVTNSILNPTVKAIERIIETAKCDIAHSLEKNLSS